MSSSTPLKLTKPVFAAFCIASAAWSIVMLIFCLYILRSDMLLQRSRKIKSKTRTSIISMALCQLINIPKILSFMFLMAFETSENSKAFTETIHRTTWVLTLFLLFFSLFSIAIPSIESMALANGGIKAVRGFWIRAINIIFYLFNVAIGIFAIVCIIDKSVFKLYLNEAYLITSATLTLVFGVVSCNFARFSRGENMIDGRQELIRQRSGELHQVTLIYTFCLITMAIFFYTQMIFPPPQYIYLWVLFLVSFGIISFFSLLDLRRLTIKGLRALDGEKSIKTRVVARNGGLVYKYLADDRTLQEFIDITDATGKIIGKAPPAPRPSWLPQSGNRKATVSPECWSITIENWLRFIQACIATDTWSYLVKVKGENNINMYDINTHFIKPWTRGTGCSISGLFGENNSKHVEVMISHAWAGSVKETYMSIESLVSLYFLPKETRIFYCTLCMYQPQDGAKGGLSIQEQLQLEPFRKIIDLKPKYGMYVLHTTLSEVYTRLWCVHEVDEGILAEIKIHGAFDSERWTLDEFNRIVQHVQTQNADCQPQDKVMLTKLIESRGGFPRLNSTIKNFRKEAKKDLECVLQFEQLFGISFASVENV